MTPLRTSDATAPSTRRRRPYVWGTAGFLALKLPLVAIALASPDGTGDLVPSTEVGPALYAGLGFLGSSILLVLLRWWFGAVSAFTYAGYSFVGGLLLMPDYTWWGLAIASTSAGALACLVLAFRNGDFSAPAPRDESEHTS
jgi:hypothetical protein